MTDPLEQENSDKHILTIVVEDYFQVGSFRKLIPNDYWGRFESRLKQNVMTTLTLLATSDSKATFFVSGWIADNYPSILKEIVRQGHEVGCQSYFNNSLSDLPRKEFIQDIRRSKEAVENAIGVEVQGFRLARGWLKPEQLWLLDELIELGFLYDSSYCKIGLKDAELQFEGELYRHTNNRGEITEVAASSRRVLGWSFPISGGNYWRQFPAWLFIREVKNWTKQHNSPLVVYFHIWELDPEQPKITAASQLQKLRHYRNLATMPAKIRYFLDNYRFTSISKRLELESPAEITGMVTPKEIIRKDKYAQAGQNIPLTLVIPCFNEEQTLPYLKNTLDRFTRRSRGVFEIQCIFIDDGSTDTTQQLLEQQFAEQENCRILKHDGNKGIAAAIITGFQHVETGLVAVLDADCTFSPEQLLQMLPLLSENVDVVAASPAHKRGVMRNVSLWRMLMSKGSAFLYSLVLRHKLTSYTSCFRLYRTNKLRHIQIYNSGFCGVTEILGRLDLAGAKIVEYPAVLEVRLLGASKINVIKTIFEHLKLVIRLASARWLGKAIPASLYVDLEHEKHER